jgi:hypothetical protein
MREQDKVFDGKNWIKRKTLYKRRSKLNKRKSDRDLKMYERMSL